MFNQELMIINACVRSVDARDSVHEALLVRDGRVASVGTLEQVRLAARPDADRFDAAGRTVVPGFVDAHNHMSVAAFEPDSADCSTPPLGTLTEVLATIAAVCQGRPAGQWIRGFGFHSSKISEGRNPTRYELDEVAPDNPFVLIDMTCHAAFANSAALATVGITSGSPDPWGGMIERDRRGNPTGVLLEAAADLTLTVSWEDYARRDPRRALGLVEAQAHRYLAAGLTGIGDACVTPPSAELYRQAEADDRLPITVQQLHGGDHFFAPQDLRRRQVVERIRGADSDRLRNGTMKLFLDRVYPDGPAMHVAADSCGRQHRGSRFWGPDEAIGIADTAARLGIGVAMHAMGNAAVQTAIEAFDGYRRRDGEGRVLRVEHATLAEAGQAHRLGLLGVDVVASPGVLFRNGVIMDQWRPPAERDQLGLVPLRTMIDAGVRVSIASDYPCGDFSPAELMWCAVTRRHVTGTLVDPEQAVTPAEALRALTANPADACGRGSEEGSIEVGKRANLAVLDRDPLTCPTDEIRGMLVDRTYVDGRLIYSRPGAS